MPTLYLMCGIPASGKSTVAKEIASAENAVIISSDEIRRALYKGQRYDSGQNERTFQEVRFRVTQAYESGQSMIIDAINRRVSERKQYAERAKRKGYRAVCVFCQKSLAHALNANRMRDRGIHTIPDGVISENYDVISSNPPDESEGWDEIRIIDGDKYSVEVEGQKP